MESEPASTKINLLLDANCIIYYCQRFDETFRGTAVQLYHPLGELVIQVIGPLISAKKSVGSISAVLSEIPDKGAEELVDDFICNPQIQRILSRVGVTSVPPRLRERWQSGFLKKVKKLRNNEWWREIDFIPTNAELQETKDFYRSMAGESKMADHIVKKGKDCPSNEDLALAICAKKLRIPILSNDGDFKKFTAEWSGFGVDVIPLI